MIENLLTELRATSRLKEKEQVLLSHDGEVLKDLIKFAYNPFTNFNVNIKPKDIPPPGEKSFEDVWLEYVWPMLTACESGTSNKNNRKMAARVLGLLNEKSQELVVNTLNKNWKAGVSAKTLLKLFPGIVPQFEVQLANTYKPGKHDCESWVWSYKLDGVRCIALRHGPVDWTLLSRQGREFLTVDHLKHQLEYMHTQYGWSFFDGELYRHGLTFEDVQGAVMAFTKGQATEIEYHVFVAGMKEDFLSGIVGDRMTIVYGPSHLAAPDIKFVNQGIVQDNADVKDIIERAFELGYEGIMLRDPAKPYDYKRSDALLKYKQGENEGEVISDCTVVSIDTDKFPVIEAGRLSHEDLLVRIWVQQKDGTECKVGSGFSIDFRRNYTEKPWELIGKDIEVKHQGYGTNGRMRFPRLHRVREDL
jgi:DNA ligase-1